MGAGQRRPERTKAGLQRAVSQGKRLSLDPALLWPMRSLDRLARAPGTLDEEHRSPDVRRWQAAEFSASLRELLEG